MAPICLIGLAIESGAAGDINGDGLADLLVGYPATVTRNTETIMWFLARPIQIPFNLLMLNRGIGGFVIAARPRPLVCDYH